MKIILVLSNNIGGLHSFRKEVMKAFVDADYKVVISSPINKGDESKAAYFDEIGCEVVNTEFNRKGTNPIKDLQLLRTYVAFIKKYKPKAVLTYTIKPNVYGGIAAARCNVPLLANVTGLGDTLENPGLMQKLNVFLYRFGLRKAHLVFFQNQENRQFFLDRNMVKSPTVLLPGSGVNLNHHTPQPYPEYTGITKFIFISRILKDKGVEELFASIENIKARHQDKVELHILGNCEDNYSRQLNNLHERGVVIYQGAKPDVRPYVASCHCLILPSYHEGMSNVLQEASAAARPVITCNVSGCKEIVEDGKSGFLCKVKDAADLEAKMEVFISLPYQEKIAMGLAARQKVERDFDRTIVINRYLEEVQKL